MTKLQKPLIKATLRQPHLPQNRDTMLFEFLTKIAWTMWLERILGAVSFFLVILILVWVVPIFINWLLALAMVHAKIRQGMVMILRLIIVTAGIFLVADILGFESDTVFAVLGTVFGVGISWAIKDNVQNALSGLQLFLFQSFGIGDRITEVNGKFDGYIRSFHLQYTLITNEKGDIFYIPNSLLWTTVIRIAHNPTQSYEHNHLTNWVGTINY
jgi:small-conductance mechanosensitive channel